MYIIFVLCNQANIPTRRNKALNAVIVEELSFKQVTKDFNIVLTAVLLLIRLSSITMLSLTKEKNCKAKILIGKVLLNIIQKNLMNFQARKD